MEDAARPELARLVTDLDARRARVDEVELVLLVVVVVEALVSRRHDDRVDAEGLDAERLAYLAKAVALAELVERPERVVVWHVATLHRRLTVVKRPFKPRWVEHRHGQTPSLHPLHRRRGRGCGRCCSRPRRRLCRRLPRRREHRHRARGDASRTPPSPRRSAPASRSRSARSTSARRRASCRSPPPPTPGRSLRRLGVAARARLGLRLRQGRLHHHELPRDPGRRIDQGHVLQQQEHQCEARRLRSLDGHRGAEGEHELRRAHGRLRSATPTRSRSATRSSPSAIRSASRGRSPRGSSAPCSARSPRRTSTRSTTSSRQTPRSTTATRAGRCSTRAAR